jgi:phosphopantetheinyl transferase
VIKTFLARWLACKPHEIAVSAKPHEKPRLLRAATLNLSVAPQFNLSHSDGYIALAIHLNKPIGIDIELSQVSEPRSHYDLEQLFIPEEIRYLDKASNPMEESKRFLILWRAKEAIMKATGLGFSLSPATFTVLEPCGMLSQSVFANERSWRLERLSLTSSVEAACAWEDG